MQVGRAHVRNFLRSPYNLWSGRAHIALSRDSCIQYPYRWKDPDNHCQLQFFVSNSARKVDFCSEVDVELGPYSSHAQAGNQTTSLRISSSSL